MTVRRGVVGAGGLVGIAALLLVAQPVSRGQEPTAEARIAALEVRVAEQSAQIAALRRREIVMPVGWGARIQSRLNLTQGEYAVCASPMGPIGRAVIAEDPARRELRVAYTLDQPREAPLRVTIGVGTTDAVTMSWTSGSLPCQELQLAADTTLTEIDTNQSAWLVRIVPR